MPSALEQVFAIAPDFSERYQIMIANTDSLRADAYRVRCQVFCEELGYEMHQLQGKESDEHDDGSLHILLRERASHVPVGCFRLVMPKPHGPVWLPFDKYGVAHVQPERFDWSTIDRANSVEISRLALLRGSRRNRQADEHAGASTPFLATAMFYAVASLSVNLGIETIFMVIEPSLGRLISRFGFRLDQISQPFEYFGRRATFTTNSVRMRGEAQLLKTPWRNLYDVIEQQLFTEALERQLGEQPLHIAQQVA